MDTTQNRGLIILDPGHGQFNNKHTTREGFYEGTQNFLLATHLRDALVSLGFEVIMTRNTVEDNPSLEERGSMSGRLGAILFLSLHSNAPGGNPTDPHYPTVRGVETYYSVSDLEGNAPIARALNDAVIEVMCSLDRGIKTRRHPENSSIDYYGVLRSAAASGCRRAFLVEHGFHTNPEDSFFLQSEDCLRRLAAAEAAVIDRFF